MGSVSRHNSLMIWESIKLALGPKSTGTTWEQEAKSDIRVTEGGLGQRWNDLTPHSRYISLPKCTVDIPLDKDKSCQAAYPLLRWVRTELLFPYVEVGTLGDSTSSCFLSWSCLSVLMVKAINVSMSQSFISIANSQKRCQVAPSDLIYSKSSEFDGIVSHPSSALSGS